MDRKLLLANLILFTVVALALVYFFMVFLFTVAEVDDGSDNLKHTPQPLRPMLSKEAYRSIGPPLLELKYSEPKLALPNLAPYIEYYGINDRPDAKRVTLLFRMKNDLEVISINENEPLYITFEEEPKPSFSFSIENEPTDLWIIASAEEDKALVEVHGLDHEGKPVLEPPKHRVLTLPKRRQMPKSVTNSSISTLSIGEFAISAKLLDEQNARWIGQDEFINKYGGKKYDKQKNRERIRFEAPEEEPYEVLVGVGECLVWKNDRWQPADGQSDSENYPLMCLKWVGNYMKFSLWAAGGVSRLDLVLRKNTDLTENFNKIKNNIRFLSVYTYSRYSFEIEGQRMNIKANDWLLKSVDGWVVIDSPEDIDRYVEFKDRGILLTVDGIAPESNGDALRLNLFSPERNYVETFDVELSSEPQQVINEEVEDSVSQEES